MQIHYKSIVHERSEDAPFIGALISATDCSFKCKGCFNRHVKKLPTLVSDEKTIISEVLSNPFNEGIILSGLEWSEQAMEMLTLCQEAQRNNLKVMIYTGYDLYDFFAKVGEAAQEKYTTPADNNLSIKILTGSSLLNYVMPNSYYIKTGKYVKDKKVDNYEMFGVKLASSNQFIYLIDNSEVKDD